MKTRSDEVAVASGPEVATADEWARRKGMANRFIDVSAMFSSPNPAYQDFAQARAHGRWIEGTELTEAQFDAAVAEAKAHTFR